MLNGSWTFVNGPDNVEFSNPTDPATEVNSQLQVNINLSLSLMTAVLRAVVCRAEPVLI
jgi:hypothetical protein